MTGYVIRRFLWMIPVLFFVCAITFFLMKLVPGGPWDAEKKLPAATIENLNRTYHLNEPAPVQFFLYIRGLLQGDLGKSFTVDKPVRDRLMEGLPITVALGLASFALGTALGITLGTIAALKQNSWIDYTVVTVSSLGASMPSFIVATFLIIVFGVKLGWFPIIAWREWSQIITEPKVAIMPVLALSLRETAVLTRVTRASVLEVVRQDYIRTARAKGLREQAVVVRHLVKNALIPILTLLGPLLAGLVTGSFIIEFIFSIPGIGRSFVTSVVQRDYGMIMGTTLFYATMVAVANLVVDLLYGVVDPRIRYS